ncbi:MAG: hypothetical protein JW795_24085, partial [Chitinivibrionales bacterium]|nr:hypothetical protein [Chitinivibrionales bacterium]
MKNGKSKVSHHGVCAGLFVFLSTLFCCSFAEKVGKILYSGYPWDFDNKTISVPFNMVALSEAVYIGIPDSISVTIDTPSVFFIIDHSGSMYEYDGDSATNKLIIPKDPRGNRFRVTSALLDTLFNPLKYPGVEVGLAVFNSCLYYDTTNGNVVKIPVWPPEYGAYAPLYKLAKEYNGRKGIDILKKLLETKMITKTTKIKYPDTTITYDYAELTARKDFFSSPSTNINIGFMACKDAMKKSTYLKKNHYVVFLSDGEANMGFPPEQYVDGKDVPTTFTVFFTHDGSAPANLQRMNANIQNNGYSTSNRLSRLWAYENTS